MQQRQCKGQQFRTIYSVSALLLLVGCSGAPSEGQITDAVLAQTKSDLEQMERAVGKGAVQAMRGRAGEVKSVKKIGCKEDGEKAYRCDIEVEVKQGEQIVKAPASMRFVKGSDGWVVAR